MKSLIHIFFCAFISGSVAVSPAHATLNSKHAITMKESTEHVSFPEHGIKGIENQIGRKYGRLEVIACEGRSGANGRKIKWTCRCDCGNITSVYTFALPLTESCGCYQKEVASQLSLKHGLYESPEYSVWSAMIQRCTNPKNPSYKNYGGRGIKVCRRWMDFGNFISDMGRRPSSNLCIEREDNDGDYEPGNCTWSTRKAELRNTRANVNLTFDGKTQCISAWEEELGFKPSTIRTRIKRGWSIERALTTLDTSKTGGSKLSKEDIIEIRSLKSKASQWAIARRFGVTQACISDILLHKTFKHL